MQIFISGVVIVVSYLGADALHDRFPRPAPYDWPVWVYRLRLAVRSRLSR